MARSSGYRANKENEERVAELRAKLAECRSDQWQRATYIMQEIAELCSSHTTGNGPSGGRVEPRACKYCKYFGHTSQHCEQKKKDEEAAMELMIAEDRRFREKQELERHLNRPPKQVPWYQRAKQEDWVDEGGLPWYRDKRLGPMVVDKHEDGGEGKWVRVAGTVKRADE